FQSAELYNNLGCLHVAQGKREQAQACFRQAIELNPSLQAAYHNRAMLSLQIDVARRNRAAPHQRLTAADVVRVFLQPAQPSDGLTVDIEKAISVGPVSADLYYNAAHLYVVAGTAKSYQVDRTLNAWEKRFSPPTRSRQAPAKSRRGLFGWFYSALHNQAVRAAEDTRLMSEALTCLERAVELGQDTATIK